MPILCLHCAAQMPDTAAFCPGCGRATPGNVRPNANVGILPEKIAGALAYVTFIPAIVFLVRPPFNRNHFVRFHSIQCILLWVVGLAAAALLRLLDLLLFYLGVVGPLLAVLISVAAGFAAVLVWLVLVIKALQGEAFALPLIGALAEQYSQTQ